jgi:hypothetical protein
MTAHEGRRYSEEEFALILRRAFELQEHPRTTGGLRPADGLTLAEIRAIALEIGLDPALIERAVASLPTSSESTAARLLGGPQTYQLEYRVDAELPRERLSRVVDAIRQATGHQGKVTEALGSTEWETVGQLSQVHVTVSPREGETSVRLIADRGAAGVFLFVVPMSLGAIAIGIVGAIIEPTGAAEIIAVVATPLATGFLTARTLWAATTKAFKKKLQGLLEATSKAVDENLRSPHPDHSSQDGAAE